MSMRGSIPRRQPDPSRRPEPRPIVQKSPQNFFYNIGDVTIPGNGMAKIFEMRFARSGRVESSSVFVTDIPAEITVWLQVLDDNAETIFETPIGKNGRTDFPDVPVEEYDKYSLWLAQKDSDTEITVRTDIVYVFQES